MKVTTALKRLRIVLALMGVLLPASAGAWHSPGHMIVAYIAYTSMDEQTRRNVDAILAKHPWHARWVCWTAGRYEDARLGAQEHASVSKRTPTMKLKN